MEGECYALMLGVMHFRQFLHHNHFIIRTNHKPLENACNNLDAYNRKKHWINMLKNLSFKILHRPISMHSNVDALNCNLVCNAESDENFFKEIQEIELLQELGCKVGLGEKTFETNNYPIYS
jgi:hypothetical protein